MKRLVYSPSIKAWVKSDSGVIDLSPYIIECNISRKIDDVSSAELVFRNPKVTTENGKNRFMFTQHEGDDGSVRPVFHPMDPITIVLERIAGRPIQVFTGYCDTTPYVQLFPGTARIQASCTLKRLLYTYWDPALPFVSKFMKAYGWDLNVESGTAVNQGQATAAEQSPNVPIKTVQLNDGTMGNLLYGVLNEIGGWDNSNIFIQPLPSNISTIVSKLFDEFTEDNKQINEEISKVMTQMVKSGHYGTAGVGGGTGESGGGGGTGTAGNNRSIAFGDVGITGDADSHSGSWTSRNADKMDDQIISFIHEVAGIWGKKIWITTGVNHNYNTANGNVSDHAMGKAADMGTGMNNWSADDLTRVGRAALKAFGYPGWANAASGPTDYSRIEVTRNGKKYGIQVIFNQEGHWDHLHIGYKEL